MRALLLLIIFVLGSPFVIADENDLYTNTYVVPPTFLSMAQAPLNDPFKNLRPPPQRKTAKQILMEAGLSFGEGASAIYNSATSQLIVRNTQDQMELVEAYIESITRGVEKQIYVTINELPFDGKDWEKAWLENVNFGEAKLEIGEEIRKMFKLPPLPKPTGKSQTRIFDSPDMFRKEFSRPPSIPSNQGERVGRKISGVLTDPQFQLSIRALNQRKEFDLQSLPSVMCRSGQLAMVQDDDKRYGVQAVLGAADLTINLSIFLPLHGEPLFDELDAVSTPHQVTIRDGQTVVIAERRENGKCRFVFVKAQMMDPSGMPIHGRIEKQKEVNKAGKDIKILPHSNAESILPGLKVSSEVATKLKKADEAALRGSQVMADRDYKGAIDNYENALKWLPEHEVMLPRRKAYEKQLSRARMLLAVDIYEVKNLEEHLVKIGETFSQIAKNSNLSVEKIRAANHLEGELLELGQVLIVPRKVQKLAGNLKTIIIPEVDFRDVPLDDALGQILVIIRKNTDRGLFPDLNPKISIRKAEIVQNPKVTLRLGNVPASDALRYITSLAQCRYLIEGEVIIVEPLKH